MTEERLRHFALYKDLKKSAQKLHDSLTGWNTAVCTSLAFVAVKLGLDKQDFDFDIMRFRTVSKLGYSVTSVYRRLLRFTSLQSSCMDGASCVSLRTPASGSYIYIL